MLWADLKPTHDSLKVLIGARIEEDSSVSDADPATSARPKRGFFHHHHHAKISRWISTQKQYDNFAHVQLTFAHNGAFLVYNNGPIGHLLS